MPPLANFKHEKFAQAVIDSPTQSEAYAKTYGVIDRHAANANSARLIAKDSVHNRVAELLASRGLTAHKLIDRFSEFVDDRDNPAQSWDAVKTGLKIVKIIQDDNEVVPTNISIQVIIG